MRSALDALADAQARLDAIEAGDAARQAKFYAAHNAVAEALTALRDAAGRHSANECGSDEVERARDAYTAAEMADRTVQAEMEGVAARLAAAEELVKVRQRRVSELAVDVALARNVAIEADATQLARQLRSKLLVHRALARFTNQICSPNEPIAKSESATVFQRNLLVALTDPASPDESITFLVEDFTS